METGKRKLGVKEIWKQIWKRKWDTEIDTRKKKSPIDKHNFKQTNEKEDPIDTDGQNTDLHDIQTDFKAMLSFYNSRQKWRHSV